MNIVLTFNLYDKKKYGYVSDEFDDKETISMIQKAIEQKKHKVFLVEGDEDFYMKVKKLKEKNKADFVFNYSVGIWSRSREAHIPAMCEMLKIPYGSSDVLSTALCQDKSRAKELLNYYGIKNPWHQLFKNGGERLSAGVRFPLIVKYNYQGSSIGLKDDKSVVKNKTELYARIAFLHETVQEPIIAEEYIKGREFTVGFYGNGDKITFFPLVEIKICKKQDSSNWVFNSRRQPVSNKVSIDKKIEKKIYGACRKIVNFFELRDWGRIDLRISERDNEPYVLEINNCAHLSKKSVYFMGAKALGISHEELVSNMLNSALERLGFK